MHRQGYSSRNIAEVFGRCISIISRLVKRCDELQVEVELGLKKIDPDVRKNTPPRDDDGD